MIDFTEIEKLHTMLTEIGIPHTCAELFDGRQIRVYADAEMTNELDDCVIHGGSYGHTEGLLETYTLNGCEGWETADQVFAGWVEMYNAAHPSTCACTCIGTGGEIWRGSMPSWD